MNRKFGRKKANREHLLRNLVTSLILFERIDTTEEKGKEVKSCLDRLLSRTRTADLSARRKLEAFLFDKNAAKKVIEELVPRFSDKSFGYVRSYHLKNRLGDNAAMMRLELVDRKVFVSDKAEAKVTIKTEEKKAKEDENPKESK
jgi:large subunit ribosomal protein L17